MRTAHQHISAAVNAIRRGLAVAFPTETVYGLGAPALDSEAVARVFALKGRPARNPVIVHVTGPQMARTVVREWTAEADALARAFWPGPLTIVLERAENLPDVVTGGGKTVGVRCPDHPATLALLFELGEALVGPSANRSGGVSPTRAAHVRAEFSESDVFVLDAEEWEAEPGAGQSHGGSHSIAGREGIEGGGGLGRERGSEARRGCTVGIESTVVSLGDSARVLRPGVISAEQISAVIGRAVIPWSPADAPTAESAASDHIASGSADGQAALESPGMLARHYAPRHEAVLIKRGREHEVGARLRAIARPVIALAWARTQATASPADVIEIAGASHPFGAAVGAARVIVVPCEPLAAARGLYDVLRRADEAAAALGAGAVICVETPQVEGGGPDAHVWGAILDRLTRACTRA